MDRRYEYVRRLLAGELTDQLGQVRLDDCETGGGERLVQLDLVRRQRLHLHGLLCAGRGDESRDDCLCLGGVAGPVDVSAGVANGRFELHEVAVEVA